MKNYSTHAPSANEIREARQQAGLTLDSASQLLYVHIDTWSKWESGARTMHPAFWELFLLKCGGVNMPIDESPKPADIQAARQAAGLTQTAAETLVQTAPAYMAAGEAGDRELRRASVLAAVSEPAKRQTAAEKQAEKASRASCAFHPR